LEDQLRGVDALVAELRDRFDHPKARVALLDDEAGHPAVARLGPGVRERQERQGVALAAVGDEELRAGDEVLVPAARRNRADRLYVGPGVRLGQREAAARLGASAAAPGRTSISTNSRTAATTGWSMGEQILQYGSMPLDDLVLGLQGAFDRLIRRLRLGAPPVPGQRRLLIVQIDGLSRAVLEDAITRGRVPFLARLLHRGGYQMVPMCVGLPTSTPAFQLAAMYGVRPDIPGFHYYDKRRKTDVYFPRGGDAAHVEHTQAAGRRGIVDGGGTYGCVFTGGAASNLLTFAMIKRPTGAGLIRAAAKLVVIGWVLVKGSIASTVEVVRALLRMVADPLSAASGNWKWLAIKLGISV